MDLQNTFKQKYQCLVCGDSRIYRGISPLAIENRLKNIDVFNFGFSSGSYSTFMLNKIQDKLDLTSAKPTLILGITPYSLTPKALIDGDIKSLLSRKKEEVFEYLYMEPIKRIFQPVGIEFLWKKLFSTENKIAADYYFQERHVDEGWIASWKAVNHPDEALPHYVRNFTDNKVSQLQIDTLMTRINLWTKTGIRVYGFRPPTTAAMVNLEDSLGGFDESTFVKQFTNAGGVWLDIPLDDFQTHDGSHLIKSSAIKLSDKLGELIVNHEKAVGETK
jgi:hypothetical protein